MGIICADHKHNSETLLLFPLHLFSSRKRAASQVIPWRVHEQHGKHNNNNSNNDRHYFDIREQGEATVEAETEAAGAREQKGNTVRRSILHAARLELEQEAV